MWFSGEHSDAGLMVGLSDLGGLSNLNDFMVFY